MVSASLQVQRAQIQRQFCTELKEPLPQLLCHHFILCVQLGLATHKSSDDWIQPP